MGGAALFFGGIDSFHQRPGGLVGVIVGLVLVPSGIVGVTWALRSEGRVSAEEREELRGRGLDDGLPMGAFMQQQRVGLEGSDVVVVFGSVLGGFGLLFGVAGLTAPNVDWWVALALASVGLLPAALLFGLGTGIMVWLTPDGIERNHWPRRSVRWADVQRIVLLSNNTPITGPNAANAADAIELQLTPAPQRRSRFSSAHVFVVRCQALELIPRELLPLIEERMTAAQNAG